MYITERDYSAAVQTWTGCHASLSDVTFHTRRPAPGGKRGKSEVFVFEVAAIT
jgi:hypothetical protein